MRMIIMKLPSQKYRKAVEAGMLNATHWRAEMLRAEANSEDRYQYRVWYLDALQSLSELGINPMYSAEEIADMLEDAQHTLKLCRERLEREAAKEAAEAAERAAEIEKAEAEYWQLRTEVLEAEGSSVNPADYTAIALWGEELGSLPYYIEAEQIRASRDGAPLSAIYKKDTGRWVTVHEIENRDLKLRLLEAIQEAA